MTESNEWMPNPSSRVYMWLQIAQHIADEIRSGVWPVDSRIPSEPALSERYGVGINTLRRALRHLREQGILESVPAKGTFVIAMPDADK